MDKLLIGYTLEMAMILPAALMALLPVHKKMRQRPAVVYALAYVLMTAGIAILAPLCERLETPTNALLLPLAGLMFIPYALMVNMSLPKKAFCFFNATFLASASTLAGLIITAPWEATNSLGVLTVRSGLTCLGIGALVCLLFARTLYVKIPYLLNMSSIDGLWKWFALAAFAMAALVIWMRPSDASLLLLGRSQPITLVLLTVFTLFIWLLYHLCWLTASRVNESSQLKQENALLKLEEKRYAELQSFVDETRALRHDFRHHLAVVDELAHAGDTEKLIDYVEQIVDAAEDRYQRQLCLNRAVDAIAIHYDAHARMDGTKITWYLDLPETLLVSETDFCSIMGNLVENALNAARLLPEEERLVKVKASMFSEGVYTLVVANRYSGVLNLDKDGLPRSFKRGHGIGMPSVAATVRRSNGTLKTSRENGIFTIAIILYANSLQNAQGPQGKEEPEHAG